jgi:TM2 domain-containing membrane protein YozV
MADRECKIFDKLPYGVCGILLGCFGVNSFIAGNIGMGVLKIIFCWTGIPGIIGLIQGILALCRPEARLKQTGVFTFEGVEGGSSIREYKV